MRFTSNLAAAGILAASSAAAAENYLGFNSGSTLADRSAKFKADFKSEFTTAQALQGAPGKFNAVRLYTNIQAYSIADPIQAFDAAIETNTKILLGIWTSGTASIDNEITALKTAVTNLGDKFTNLVIGISIGSEDLYRDSVTGITNKAGVGAGPKVIVDFINTYKKAVAGTKLENVPVGHVDTWDAWTNGTNKAVVDAIDWVGVDEYPYYENTKDNDIKNAGALFDAAYDATIGAVGGKPVWVTETGWPTTGPNFGKSVPSVANAKTYWDEVGCRRLFGKTPTFWYNLRDSNPENTMKFAITNNLSTQPLYNLTCPTTFNTPSTTAGGSSSSPASTGASVPSSSRAPNSSGGSNTGSTSNTGTTDGSSTSTAESGNGSNTTTSAPNPSKTSGAGKATAFAGLALLAGVVAALF
ncbi:glycoside hydrolase family 17 protein [Lasiosphaeria ovina]|uniref:Glycoside hydrolase family 17 protein n=1 Tax=Lasiosphaeria ovina TaxID=92902 RepID=A0AAE0NFE2_9PEZI|nr:glycoside hydrolase family 17 protein [Lasiosphaeria ovina]